MLRFCTSVIYWTVIKPWRLLESVFGGGTASQSKVEPTVNRTEPSTTNATDPKAGDLIDQQLAAARKKHCEYPIPLSMVQEQIARRVMDGGDLDRAESILGEIPERSHRSRLAVALAGSFWRCGQGADCDRLIARAERDSRDVYSDDWSERSVYDRADCLDDIADLYATMGRFEDALSTANDVPEPTRRLWAVGRILRQHLEPADASARLRGRLREILDESRRTIEAMRDDREQSGALKALAEVQSDIGDIDAALHTAAGITNQGSRDLAYTHIAQELRQRGQSDRAAAVCGLIEADIVRDRVAAELDEPSSQDMTSSCDPLADQEQAGAPGKKSSARSPELNTEAEAERAQNPPTFASSSPGKTDPSSEQRFSVTVIDNFHRHDPDETFTVHGFTTRTQAEEYAVRRVRSSIEQFRAEAENPNDLRHRWNAMGEEVVVEGCYIGLSRFDEFAAEPASREECDYLALTPRQSHS